MRLGSHLSLLLSLETFAEPFPARNAHPCRKRETVFSDLVLNRQEQFLYAGNIRPWRRNLVQTQLVETSAWGLVFLAGGFWAGLLGFDSVPMLGEVGRSC